jgi:iron complex outermembrane receptor protein
MKSKLLITGVAILLLTLNAKAQHKISGNITDEKTNEPLAGVSVHISDLRKGSSTDKTGFYQIENIKKGNYLVEVSIVGYKTITKNIVISKDTMINFVMNDAVAELNEVVITGVTRSTELKQSPVIIKPIDANTLNQNSSTNLIDALKNVPGVNQITTGGAISKPVIRGLGYNRVISLYNGIRQEGQQWGDEHGIEIDEYSIDRIEIIKGPGSLMYGSDGIAGVLNFISPKAPPLGQVKTQLISNYQSNNNLIGYSLSNAGSKNGVQWLGRVSNKFAGNYQNSYDGKVYGTGFREINANVFLGVTKNWGYSHFNISTFNQYLNLPEGERDSLGNFVVEKPDGSGSTVTTSATSTDLNGGYKRTFPSQTINHLRLMSNNYFILNKGSINFDLHYQNNKRKEYANVLNPDDVELFFDLHTINYNLRYNFERRKGWETSVGISGMQQSNANKGEEFLIPAYNLFDIGGFVHTQKRFNNKLTLAGGLRVDNRLMNSKELILDSNGEPTTVQDTTTELKFNPFTKNYNGISGSIGLSYQASKISTFKMNLSRGFRAPNISEIGSNGRHEGAFRYEIGTPNLKSEISHQVDIAYFLNSDHITFELTPYANFISNYVFIQKMVDENGNDIIPNPSDPAPAFQYTQGNATLLGGEVYLDIHPHLLDWLHIENSFSYVQATQRNHSESSKYLPLIPAPKYKGELRAQFKKTGKNITNGYVKFGVDHFFKQNQFYSAYGNETETSAYTLLSAGIGGDIKAFNRNNFMSIFVSAENLADVAYQSHLSRLKYAPENLATGRTGIFNMGRNISVKLIFNL